MSQSAANLTEPQDADELVVYEQPLNEKMRTLLRLEFLFRQTEHHAAGDSSWESRAAIGSLLDILSILTRGDVRKDVLKELERHAGALGQFRSRQGVDTKRLGVLMEDILEQRDALNAVGGQLTASLKNSEFLNAVKHRSAIPGGTCEFDLPDYNHWLNRSYQRRMEDFSGWFESLKPLREGVNKLLWLTREGAKARREVATGGMFQHALERGVACQLLRVALPATTDLFPEISGSPHRFTVRFHTWHNVQSRPSQTTDDVEFFLTCC
ncbi:MAG: cell division protein ZapD [Pseudomonadota bacterium]